MASQRMQSWKALEPGSKHYLDLESMLMTIVLVLNVCAQSPVVSNYLQSCGL